GKACFTVNRIRSQDDRVTFIIEQKIKPSESLLDKPWSLLEPKSFLTEKKHDSIDKNDASVSVKKVGLSEGDALKNTGMDKQEDDYSRHVGTEESKSKVSGTEQNKSKGKAPPKVDRNVLVPSYVKFNFRGHKKCSRIFNELKSHLTFDNTPNAISILL
ncbi:hypothetical protein FJK77_22535, partial [Escherichia coli]|nr:hypothetical protein [Escherichia coli]